MDNLTELYCHIDDFYQQFKPEFDAHLIATGGQRLRSCQISVAEIMTVLVLFHQEPMDEALLNHRALVETVFGELKNLCQIEHSRHRSVTGFITNLLSGLIAYC